MLLHHLADMRLPAQSTLFTWGSSLGKPPLQDFVDDEVEQMPNSQNEDLQIPPHRHKGQVCYRKVSDEREIAKLQNTPSHGYVTMLHTGGEMPEYTGR